MDISEITYLISFLIVVLFFICGLLVICLERRKRRNDLDGYQML
jgi:hypothetical protein